MTIGGAALVLGWLGIGTAQMITGSASDATMAAKTAELSQMQSQIAAMRSSSTALQGAVATRAAALEARQAFLAQLLLPKRDLKKLAELLPREGAAEDVRDMVGSQNAMLEPFRKLESQQLAFVDKAAAAADARLRDTQSLVRGLGLDPDRLVAQSSFGTGGPYIPADAADDAEPRFKDLFLSWKKLEALENAMAAVPSYMPVRNYSYTSGFGVRYDPFTGGAAMHAGLDMAGAMGEPIYAAASGTVITANRSGGYGNLVELDHGKGMATRYGHLSYISVYPGQRITQGDVIGRMGSTGRSTGTHLHFEVRIDGRAVNPRPYLDASTYMLASRGRMDGPQTAETNSLLTRVASTFGGR